jgi:hypothetical protein
MHAEMHLSIIIKNISWTSYQLSQPNLQRSFKFWTWISSSLLCNDASLTFWSIEHYYIFFFDEMNQISFTSKRTAGFNHHETTNTINSYMKSDPNFSKYQTKENASQKLFKIKEFCNLYFRLTIKWTVQYQQKIFESHSILSSFISKWSKDKDIMRFSLTQSGRIFILWILFGPCELLILNLQFAYQCDSCAHLQIKVF